MATRKKKSEVTNEVKIVKGSHLTVTTHPDGRTELEWDDEALLRDVRAAILKAESTVPAAEKKTVVKVKTEVAKKKPAAKPKAETVKTAKKKPAAITATKTTKKKVK